MAVFTKKSFPNTSGTHRTKADLPSYQREAATLHNLQTELAKVAAEIERTGATSRYAESRQQADAVQAAIAIAAGTTTTVEVTPLPAELVQRQDTLAKAIEAQQRRMLLLGGEWAAELYHDWEQEHLAARKRIANAVVELAEAWTTERDLAGRIHAAGGLESPLYGSRLLCNFANCAKLPGVLQGFQLAAFREANKNLLKA